MSKKIFMICNAHLDPVWQWQWEEGAAAALSTFRTAAEFCEEYDGFVFNHNEALLYQWTEEYEPALFQRIQALVKAGKWHIMGGWYVQPDCNMPSGEGIVRQALTGRRYFKEKFGVTPKIGINFDPFGHSRGFVQILSKSGYTGYLFCRPSEVGGLPGELFRWKGFDGSEITARRVNTAYSSELGHAADKVRAIANGCAAGAFELCLWGVGDHGGGPSRHDIEEIDNLQRELSPDIVLIHTTPEAYFEEVTERKCELPEFSGDLNPWAVGCYTSQIRIKQQYRRIESELFMTERMCMDAAAAGLLPYPDRDLSEAQKDMLMIQFHDILPGSSVQPAEEASLRMLGHGLELLSRVKARAFFALSAGQRRAAPDEIPILVYNPHPYEIEGDFECEMMLWSADFGEAYSVPQVYQNGTALATQSEKEDSNINIDWRKRAVFHAQLAPMQMSRFDCKYTKLKQKPQSSTRIEDASYYYLSGGAVRLALNKSTGSIDSWQVYGREYLSSPILLNVIADSCDPWEMCVNEINQVIGHFTLLSEENGTKLSGVRNVIPSVRILADGAVRTVAEVVLGYGNSRAVMTYIISKSTGEVTIKIRLQWAEPQRMVKFCIPAAIENARCLGQTAYGVQELPEGGRENVSQRYILLDNGNDAMLAANDGVYGSCYQNGALSISLLRSAAYCAHPIGDRDRIPQDRFTPHIDIGERLYEFTVEFGKSAAIMEKSPRRADILNERPMILSFFPDGSGTIPPQSFTLSGDPVQAPVLKMSEDGLAVIVRLFNPFERTAAVQLSGSIFKTALSLTIKPYEIITVRIEDGRAYTADLNENKMAEL